MNFFLLVSVGAISPILQVVTITALFCVAGIQQHQEVKRSGKMYGIYPPSILLLLVPIYEEVIFRGLIFGGLLVFIPIPYAIAISSLLFGIWHIKNLRWDGRSRVIIQVLWAGAVLGPLLAYLTLWSGSIWLSVIFHYVNNIWAPISEQLLKKLKWRNALLPSGQ